VATTIRPEGITNPPIDDLLDTAGSKYQLVIYAAKRARQINAYYSQLGEGLLEYVGPLVETQLREINSKLLNTEHVDPEVLAQEEAEMEQRRLAAIQDQQRYNAGYDNSFAGVYEETFEETAEVITEDVVVQADAAVVTDNQDGDDAASSEETVS